MSNEQIMTIDIHRKLLIGNTSWYSWNIICVCFSIASMTVFFTILTSNYTKENLLPLYMIIFFIIVLEIFLLNHESRKLWKQSLSIFFNEDASCKYLSFCSYLTTMIICIIAGGTLSILYLTLFEIIIFFQTMIIVLISMFQFSKSLNDYFDGHSYFIEENTIIDPL